MTKFPVVYIKTVIWAGKPKHYVGPKPADPTAHPCSKLGGYIYASDSLESARSYARCVGITAIEQDPYVGF